MVSAECAESLAFNVKRKFEYRYWRWYNGCGRSDPHDGKPVGTVWIGIALPNEKPETYKLFYQDQEILTAYGRRDLRFIILIKELSEK